MELEMDFLTLRKLLQKFCSYKCQFCTSHAGLSSSYDGREKCKEKVSYDYDQKKEIMKITNTVMKAK